MASYNSMQIFTIIMHEIEIFKYVKKNPTKMQQYKNADA